MLAASGLTTTAAGIGLYVVLTAVGMMAKTRIDPRFLPVY
jgi:hypothetical protein